MNVVLRKAFLRHELQNTEKIDKSDFANYKKDSISKVNRLVKD